MCSLALSMQSRPESPYQGNTLMLAFFVYTFTWYLCKLKSGPEDVTIMKCHLWHAPPNVFLESDQAHLDGGVLGVELEDAVLQLAAAGLV